MTANRLKIVCLGDSITYGFPWGPQVSWVNMLDEAVAGEVINMGINGNTTSDMARRFDRAVLNHQPTHLILMGGINDVICGESFDRITFNIRTMLEKALQENIKVILGLPTAVDVPEWEKLIQRIRSWIKTLADEKGLDIIEFHRAFYNEKGKVRSELLLADGGHPTVQGYIEMFAQIDLSIFKPAGSI